MRTKTALLVGRQQFLRAYKESGLRFQRNKMWRSMEYTIPFNRPSTKTSKDQSRLLSISILPEYHSLVQERTERCQSGLTGLTACSRSLQSHRF